MLKPMKNKSTLVTLVVAREGTNSSPYRTKATVVRLESLRRRILLGSYHVKAELLADAMLHCRGLLKKTTDVGFN